MTDPALLVRLARSVQVRAHIRSGIGRGARSLPAAIQITVAVVASYSIAHYLLGHPAPFIAIAVTITSLGLGRDARPRKVFDTALGVTIGITLSELLVLGIGRGPLQIAVVIFAVLLISRVVSPNPALAVVAAVQSGLVVAIPATVAAGFTRTLDAVVAGAVALVVTALVPRNPGRESARDRRRLFASVDEAIGSVVDSLADGDEAAGELGLARLRRTQTMLDAWAESRETLTEVARFSPFLRRRRPELVKEGRILSAADLATRHLRAIARRVAALSRDGRSRPLQADIMRQIATGMRLLGQEVSEPEITGAARSLLQDVARRLDPTIMTPDAGLIDASLILMLRPLVVDLLVGTGLPIDDARALLPPI